MLETNRKKGEKYMKKEELAKKIKQSSLSNKQLAKQVGIDEATFYRKMKKDGETFTIAEAKKIIKELHLTPTEACDIFFEKKLA